MRLALILPTYSRSFQDSSLAAFLSFQRPDRCTDSLSKYSTWAWLIGIMDITVIPVEDDESGQAELAQSIAHAITEVLSKDNVTIDELARY